jgi:hypothetical protein
MRQETVVNNIYKFEELTGEAKSKALDSLRDINIFDDWFDFVYDDFKDDMKENHGIEVKEIQFSGFYSQGDGASFETDWFEHSEDIQLRIARISSLYCHENTMIVDSQFDNWDDNFEKVDDIEKEFLELCRDKARYLYKILESSYNYLTSDESIIEAIEANDYEFNENGELYK